MGISFVASTRSPTSYPSSTNNTSTCNISKPSGTTAGDVMLVYLESGNNASFSYPSGWREVANYKNSSASMTSGIAYKVATGSEGSSYSFGDSQGGLTPLCGMILTYRGVAVEDPISDPVNAHAESDTGTSGTSAVAAPDATSTADGWYVWFRAGKISTNPPPSNSFNVSGGTARQATSNRGGSTAYFVGSADSNGSLSTGSHSGATFTRSGTGTFSGSIARTIVLKQAGDPVDGDFDDVGLGGITLDADGEVHNDSTVLAQLGPLSAEFDGEHFPPGVGQVGVALGSVGVELEANSTGGPAAFQLAPAEVAVEGSVNPIGSLGIQLAAVQVGLGSETRVFGKNVITVELEKRAFRITQDEMIPIYKLDVDFPETAAPIELQLGGVGVNFEGQMYYGSFGVSLRPVVVDVEAETTSGDILLQLGGIGVDFEVDAVNPAAFTAQLAPVTATGDGEVHDDAVIDTTLGGVTVEVDATAHDDGGFTVQLGAATASFVGAENASGTLGVDLGFVEVQFQDNPIGGFTAQLGGVTVEADGEITDGNSFEVQLGAATASFAGTTVTEDLLKYADDIGDGSSTTITVTHSAGTRDVVVSVFDNTTYEEVVPLTKHATTNTVTLEFATAPATDAYRVVVLYSAV